MCSFRNRHTFPLFFLHCKANMSPYLSTYDGFHGPWEGPSTVFLKVGHGNILVGHEDSELMNQYMIAFIALLWVPFLVDSAISGEFIWSTRATPRGVMRVATRWVCENSFQDQRNHDVAVWGERKEIPKLDYFGQGSIDKLSIILLSRMWI